MSILIVDDFEEQRELLARTLKAAGYRSLLFAESAAEALKCLGVGADARPSDRIDVVLMDLLMPDMDGLEACLYCRRDGLHPQTGDSCGTGGSRLDGDEYEGGIR